MRGSISLGKPHRYANSSLSEAFAMRGTTVIAIMNVPDFTPVSLPRFGALEYGNPSQE